MSFYSPTLPMDFAACWPRLLTLCCDFYGLRGSNSLLLSLLNGPFNRTLEALTLQDCRLLRRTMRSIVELCPSLQYVALKDVTVKVRCFENVCTFFIFDY